MLYVSRAITNIVKRISMEHMSFMCEDGFPGVKMSLQENSSFERRIVGIWIEQIVSHWLDMGMVLRI